LLIGKIVSSSSHVDYICQVYAPGETELAPQPQDYGFGTFVGIEQGGAGYLVGVIYNTTLMNPEFGNLGPRLSPREELAVFSPDYLAEKVTLVAVVILGASGAEGNVHQGVPVVAATLDARVRRLSRDEVVAFHHSQAGLRVKYLPMLATMNNPLAPHLMLHIIDQLSALFPQEAQCLAILASNLAWKSRVEPMG
jgi:hypothetical protein